jgi:hypothetical protein
MNDYSSPLGHMDGLRSSSPKRKRLRQKYAPKACRSRRSSVASRLAVPEASRKPFRPFREPRIACGRAA